MKNIKYTTILLFIFFSIACNQSKDVDILTEEDTENQQPSLLIKDILATNKAVKIDSIQTKVVKQTIKCTGRIDIPPNEMLSVHSRTAGFIEDIKFLPGDYVKKGALLLTIVNPELVVKQRLFLETKAEYNRAAKDFARKQTLYEEQATSQKTYEESNANFELLRAKYLGLKNELQLLGINVKALEEEQKYQNQIGLYAADEGWVHSVFANKGKMVSPQDKLMEIANNNHVHLELQVLAKDSPLLEKGQPVKFTLPNRTEQFNATIVKLNPMVNDETGTLNIHCHIEDEDATIVKAGMFINAEITVDANKVKGLPAEALIKEGENYFAYVVEGDYLIKHLLKNTKELNGFITFDDIPYNQMLVEGAYYVE